MDNEKRIKTIEGRMKARRLYALANDLAESSLEMTALSKEELETVMWLAQILPKDEDKVPPAGLIAELILLGRRNCENAMETVADLLEVDVSEVYRYAERDCFILLVTKERAEAVFAYLKGIGMTREQIREVYFEAVLLGEYSLRERCETALTYLTVDDLAELSRLCFFRELIYSDVSEALVVAANLLGRDRMMDFFKSHPSYFLDYRAAEYRSHDADRELYQNTVAAIEFYRREHR